MNWEAPSVYTIRRGGSPNTAVIKAIAETGSFKGYAFGFPIA
ncbi:hypothetical protein VB735_04650 [Halotia wernerae UHCC 0503]|nr:hypothetical protein [Halotia wernerae UHCC 0503]